MFEKLNEIELQGKKYPIKCDLLVLEEIQNEFASLNEFEKGLITVEKIEEEKDEIEEALEEELGERTEEDMEREPGEDAKKIQYKVKFPDMKKVSAALFFMVNEGEEITAELEGRDPVKYTRKELARKVGESVIRVANQLHDEFYRCFFTINPKSQIEQSQENKKTQE